MKKLVSVLLMLALLCGGVAAMAECAHTNATFQNKGYQEQLTLVGHGDGTHTRTFKVFHTYLCDDCGVEFSKYLEDGEEHEPCVYKGNGVTCDICKLCNNHTFTEGVCSTCGYECGHADSTKKNYGTWVNAVYTNLGNTVGHHAKYDYAEIYDCNTCGESYEVIIDWDREDDEPHEWELRPEANLDSCRFCGAKKPCDVHSFDDKGICTVCGYGCEHEDATKADYVKWLNAVYTNVDEENHHAVYDAAEVYTCNDCGNVEYVILEEDCEEDEWHEWLIRPDAGLTSCTMCGAKKPCDTHTKGAAVSVAESAKTYTSTSAGHVASYTRSTVYSCSVCGWDFSETENITEAQAAHTFSNSVCTVCDYTCTHTYVDGVCSACGFGCAHENAAHNGKGTSKLVSAEDHLDGTHTREFEVWHNYECPSCKYVFEKFIEMGTETEEHNFGHDGSKDACVVCGAKKACDTHTKGKTVSTTSSTKTYTSTAEGHTASYTRTSVYNCSVCGWNYSETENITEPQEKHSFSGSTCTVCDYTCTHSYVDGVCSVCGKTCAHENAAHNGTGTSKLKSFVDHHDGTHTRTFEVWHNYECPTCKYVFEKYIEMGTETETHEYGNDGTCHVCGAKPACDTHTKTSIIKETDGEKTYPMMGIDYTHHTAVFERTTLYNCGVCGWQFSEKQTVMEKPEEHNYVDSVCSVCANVCTHAYDVDNMYCLYCKAQAPTRVEETTVEKALEVLPEESKEALAKVNLDTAEKITEKLTETAVEKGYAEEQVQVMDVTLQVQVTDVETGKEEWVEVTPENFPTEGLEVTFDPPAGTNVNDYNFVVVHMFTSPEKAGQVEVLTPTIRDGKLVVTFSSLSPVSISWKAKPQSGAALPQTGDDSMLLLWAALLTISCTVLFVKKRSRA